MCLNKLCVRHTLNFAILMMAFTFGMHVNATETDFWNENTSSKGSIDHSKWQAILDKYIQVEKLETESSAINFFRYGAVSKEDVAHLKSYLSYLQSIEPRDYSSQEQFAYWVNLYNALTIHLVLENYPVKSITKIGSFFSFGPWDDEVAEISAERLTLNDIEHKILRPIWKDPRIHYAVNCASFGCPNLSAKAFTAENAEELLEQGARDYVNHSRGVLVKGKNLILSKIYKWYVEDFGNTEAGVIEHMRQYASPDLVKRIESFDGKIKYEYNWDLNEKK